MHAQLIRPSRYGEPRDAFAREAVAVPELGPRDVLVYVMAAGVNYNNVWAAMGIPVDVVQVDVHNQTALGYRIPADRYYLADPGRLPGYAGEEEEDAPQSAPPRTSSPP